uniref:Origin recognition complex subunit 4 C-terminal domain-containing protein n=1 Tax=Hyaloperonospora arabidopsidis (strain Emoy2) TaxID=559515 RepID=M4C3V7_HYAAE
MYLKEEVLSARSALRMRLKSEVSSAHTFVNGNEVTGQGSLEAVTQLEQLFERTVQVGENQSGLLLGSDSSRRRFIVTHAMRNLRGKFGDFTVVYLNGVILQNELEAFKEFTAQLTRATAVKHPARDIKMGVLGITDNYNVVDNLEKRVRSRFSNLQIIVERLSFAQIRQHLVHLLSLDTFPWSAHSELRQPSTEYAAAFSCGIKELLLEQSKFLASLEFDYDIGKPQVFFVRLTSAAVQYLDIDAPLLSAQHFWRARQLLEQDHQLAVLETVTEHGIALLIGMGHLEKGDQKVFTLEMVYARWENFLRQHDMLTQLPTRSEAQKALENLLRLKLVKDAGDAFKIGRGGDGCMKQHISALLQPEFCAVHLNFAPRTLEGMLRNGSIKCSTLLKEWAINGS